MFTPTWLGNSMTALVSNAPDLARFYRALYRGHLLRPDLVKQMQNTVPLAGAKSVGYGQGLFGQQLGCGTAFGHAGAIPGFLAETWSSKDGSRQAVVLMNIGEYSSSARIGVCSFGKRYVLSAERYSM